MDFAFELLTQLWPGFVELPNWLQVAVITALPGVPILVFIALCPLLYVYAERKIAGFMQDRLGPMRVGPYGLLQTIADTIKLIFKEAIFPKDVDKKLFLLAPCLVFVGAFLSFVVLPFGKRLVTADLNVGVFYVAAISSLSVVGLIMAGWASNNKYALFGGMRSAAQIVSYEIPAVMTLLVVVMIVGSLSLQDIVFAQAGGLQNWFVFRYFPIMPIAFLVFFTAGMAECNRTPFDIPEAESELVAGFHTEYSGFFFALFFLSEYTEMFAISAVTSVLFLGGWHTPFPGEFGQVIPAFGPFPDLGLGWFWLIFKAFGLIFIMMWLRWTLPRLRVDQLMFVAWKVLLPIALVLVVVVGGLALWEPTKDGFAWDQWAAWITTVGLLGLLAVAMAKALRWRLRRPQEYAA
jgi:NADH-quinone oxidoreductase subunit H